MAVTSWQKRDVDRFATATTCAREYEPWGPCEATCCQLCTAVPIAAFSFSRAGIKEWPGRPAHATRLSAYPDHSRTDGRGALRQALLPGRPSPRLLVG